LSRPSENERLDCFLLSDDQVLQQTTPTDVPWAVVLIPEDVGPALASLVLSAVGISHRIDADRHILLVRETDRDRARTHLLAFAEENRGWPVPKESPPEPGNPPARSTVLLFGCLAIFFQITGSWDDTSPWFSLGAVDSGRILHQGEWWRLVTALTLHADYVHLFGNCLIGGAVVYLLGQHLGYGLAWLAVILAGTSGNLLNIVLRSGSHLSVGFSTAVFAAIGIFSGSQLGIGQHILQRLLLSLGAGLGLLALLGTGGGQTDLGAHFFGFCSGLLFGLAGRQVVSRSVQSSHFWQFLCLVTTLGLIVLSWLAAWNTAS